ncbi:hypothetical protein HKD37_20G056765 [Glycine soja]
MVFSFAKRESGRPRRTLEEIVKGDLMVNNISKSLIFNRTERYRVIQVANLTYWDKLLLFLCYS